MGKKNISTGAWEQGVIFIRYSLNNKPVVSVDGDAVKVTVTDHVLGRPMELSADMVALATANIPLW
ncbi:MAG: hypothetical protein R2875_15680 [Desulfobacterales bacterium]